MNIYFFKLYFVAFYPFIISCYLWQTLNIYIHFFNQLKFDFLLRRFVIMQLKLKNKKRIEGKKKKKGYRGSSWLF